MKPPSLNLQPLTVLAVTLALSLALPARAQDDAGRASREREALRRAQSALKQSQEQQAALTREKADIAAERDKLSDSARRAESQLGATRATVSRTSAELARVTAELGALRSQSETDRKVAQERSDELSKRLADASRVAAERTRTVASLIVLLERNTKALAAAEKANLDMYGFGLQLIEQVRSQTAADTVMRSEPVLGFSQVRLENQAEELKDRLAALKLNAASNEK